MSAPYPAIRPAATADIGAVLALRDRVALDLLQRGLLQWDPSRITAADLVDVIDGENLFVVGEVVASVSVRFDTDPLWPVGRAAYLQMLMVEPAQQRSGLGKHLVDWACRYGLATGRDLVRLDCPQGADGLKRFYEEIGFKQLDTRQGMALFELRRS